MKTLTASAVLLTLAVAGCGGGSDEPQGAAAKPAASKPLEITLKPAHHSGVSGTATIVPDGANLKVDIKLDKRVQATLMAHIHTGPCSDEPTAANPRIWAGLNDVVNSRSNSTVYDVGTIEELETEGTSINVHDPEHNQRPLVCGDIPGDAQ
jgi:CHRD domain